MHSLLLTSLPKGFPISGDGQKPQAVISVQSAPSEHCARFQLGFGQPLVIFLSNFLLYADSLLVAAIVNNLCLTVNFNCRLVENILTWTNAMEFLSQLMDLKFRFFFYYLYLSSSLYSYRHKHIIMNMKQMLSFLLYDTEYILFLLTCVNWYMTSNRFKILSTWKLGSNIMGIPGFLVDCISWSK